MLFSQDEMISNHHFLVQSSLSQGQNIFHFDDLKQIHFEKLLSDENLSATLYERVFNGAWYLTYQTLWLLFLFQYEKVSVCNWDIMTCSLLDFLKAGLHAPKVGWI